MFESLKLVKKTSQSSKVKFQVKNINIGSDFLAIVGPCSVESEEQIFQIAQKVKKNGANMLRGGVFKPRTSPYAFQGLGFEGLKYLKQAGDAHNLPVVTEIVDVSGLHAAASLVDIIQIGARSMQNFALLKEVGKLGKPVILKRNFCATLEEWFNSAEYILCEGNDKVILCERGIRTFEPYTRNTLDLSSIAVVKEMLKLPVIVDPSHGTGIASLISPMCLAAAAGGVDGLMLEVHTEPEKSISDAKQTITPIEFGNILQKVNKILDLKLHE